MTKIILNKSCFICMIIIASASAFAVEIFVAPYGSDKNAGSEATPFASLFRAQSEVHKLRQRGNNEELTITLKSGVYHLFKSFELSEKDSNTQYRAEKDGKVVLSGGIQVTDFTIVSDPDILAKLAPEVHGKVLQANLKVQGINEYGNYRDLNWHQSTGANMELYFDGKPMILARWPNDKWAWIEKMSGEKAQNPAYHQMAYAVGSFFAPSAVFERKNRLELWKNEPHLMAHGYWYYDWAPQRMEIGSVDADKKIITVKNSELHRMGFRPRQRFYIYNALCELDSPGEYYVDKEKGILYFYPPENFHNQAIELAMLCTPLIKIENGSNIVFERMIFEKGRTDGISISGGKNNQVIASTIRNMGQTAVSIKSGFNHQVIGCDIYNIGEMGILLSGGDVKQLIPGNHLACNNYIHDYGIFKPTYRPGIRLMGVGNHVKNNLICNAPHFAIHFLGNDHVIEFNEIHSVNLDSADTGAVYCGRSWTNRGNIIRSNYLHHITGDQISGIYLDDMFSSADITGNIFYKLSTAVLIGGGRDNQVMENLFIDCEPSIYMDARGTWPASQGFIKAWLDEFKSKGTIEGVVVDKEPYISRYPKLATIFAGRNDQPEGTLITRNISWGGIWMDIHKNILPYCLKLDNNLVGINPGFVNFKKYDFQLDTNSPAWKINFKQIPFDQIGLQNTATRASWPVCSKITPSNNVFSNKPSLLTETFVVKRNPSDVENMIVEQNVERVKTAPACTIKLSHDGNSFLISANIVLKENNSIVSGDTWGKNDAVEIAIDASKNGKTSTLVLHGFASGKLNGFELTGTQENPIDLQSIVYSAQIINPERWKAEWKIPFSIINLNLNKNNRKAFNFTVRKPKENLWQMWIGTFGQSFNLKNAGFIEFEK